MPDLLSPGDIERIRRLRLAVVYATLGSLFLSKDRRQELAEVWLWAGLADDAVLEAQLDLILDPDLKIFTEEP